MDIPFLAWAISTLASLVLFLAWLWLYRLNRQLREDLRYRMEERAALLEHIDRLTHPERHPEVNQTYEGVPEGGILIPPGGSATIRLRIPIEVPKEEKHDG